jgi:hypothetical protein
MNKLLLVALFFVNSVFALDADYIRVTAQGNSIESVKENAFRKAIEIKVGSVIISERIAVNEQLINNQIDSYSAGYITDYVLVSMSQNGNTFVATYDIKVESSKLVNQKQNTGRSDKALNGDNASVAFNTYMDQKHKGDILLRNILSGYPKNAISLTQRSYTIGVDSYRNAVLEISYHINWNAQYLEALDEALGLLAEKGGYFEPGSVNVALFYKNPDKFFGKTSKHKFNDINVLNQLLDSVTGARELRVMLILRDNSYNVLYTGCVVPDMIVGKKPALYDLGQRNGMHFLGHAYEDSIFKLPIPESYARTLIPKISNVELKVAPQVDCQK